MKLEILLKRLKTLAPYVTDEDILKFRSNSYSISKKEIKEYLNGNGIDSDIAYDLYHFFKNKIIF